MKSILNSLLRQILSKQDYCVFNKYFINNSLKNNELLYAKALYILKVLYPESKIERKFSFFQNIGLFFLLIPYSIFATYCLFVKSISIDYRLLFLIVQIVLYLIFYFVLKISNNHYNYEKKLEFLAKKMNAFEISSNNYKELAKTDSKIEELFKEIGIFKDIN